MSKQNEVARTYPTAPIHEDQGGPGSAGQSGDTQGLSDVAEAGSESVKELLEEGQYFEAEVLLGVEAAADRDTAEVTSSEVPDEELSPEQRDKIAKREETQG
ncbi:hypothetical protein [Paludibaculum fermentans]|uniref:hypothetical protein n=1 Tax=Paludibaculum fermentans TaxID=1473598 RepID=UPI003EC03481